MDLTDKICDSMSVLTSAVHKNRGIIDAVLTNFFTEDLFQNFIPDDIKDSLCSLREKEILELSLRGDVLGLPSKGILHVDYPICRSAELEEGAKIYGKHDTGENNPNYFVPTNSICEHMNLCSVCQEELEASVGDTTSSGATKKHNTFVGVKKEYEVKKMVPVITRLCSHLGVRNVVDVGSGRGILGHILSKEYGICVLGIESSGVSIHGGNQRIKKVNKQCSRPRNQGTDSYEINICTPLKYEEGACSSQICGIDDLSTGTYLNKNQRLTEISGDGFADSPGSALLSKASGGRNVTEEKSTVTDKTCEGTYETLLYEVKSGKEGNDELIKLLSNYEGFNSEGYLLIGLHSCGDLTPSIINVFHADSSAVGLCLVGCCYNLLTDIVCTDSAVVPGGFPMSMFLRDRRFYISRAGKHLACQCPIKMAQERRLPGRSLLFRAIFQVILRDLKWSAADANVFPKLRRMYNKHDGFTSYAQACYLKLTGRMIPMDDEEIMSYYEKYQARWQELLVYNQVHSSLAPFLEILILLDRLAYLQELGYQNSEVTQLFCPLKSPRCFALVAKKR